MPRLLVLAAVVLSLSLPLVRADWPQFRGPTGQGVAESATLPTEWDKTKNVTWRTEVPGLGWSSPVVVGGKVYLTTAVGGKDDPGRARQSRATMTRPAERCRRRSVEGFRVE